MTGRTTEADAPERRDLLPVAARALWAELPVLALGSAAVALPTLAALLLGAGVTPLTPLLLALLAGPTWAALVACTNAIVLEGEAGPARFWRELRRHWTDGLRVLAVPGVACALGLADLAVYRARPGAGTLAALTVACVVTGCTVLLAVVALPLRVEGGLRGRALWLTAGTVVTSRPLLGPGVLGLAYLSVQLGTAVLAPGARPAGTRHQRRDLVVTRGLPARVTEPPEADESFRRPHPPR
jgi:hypothetical protein